MTKELREKMERLRAVAPKLNAATDEAAKVVDEVERFLGELSLGVAASAPNPFRSESWKDEDGARQYAADFRLAYGRCAGKLRIYVERDAYEVDDTGEWHRDIEKEAFVWSSRNRDEKLDAFAQLPALLDAIADRAESLTSKAAETAATVRGLLDGMGHKS